VGLGRQSTSLLGADGDQDGRQSQSSGDHFEELLVLF
jgi:hypothetical protein